MSYNRSIKYYEFSKYSDPNRLADVIRLIVVLTSGNGSITIKELNNLIKYPNSTYDGWCRVADFHPEIFILKDNEGNVISHVKLKKDSSGNVISWVKSTNTKDINGKSIEINIDIDILSISLLTNTFRVPKQNNLDERKRLIELVCSLHDKQISRRQKNAYRWTLIISFIAILGSSATAIFLNVHSITKSELKTIIDSSYKSIDSSLKQIKSNYNLNTPR